MTWLNNPGFTIDEASQRGVDVYELLVDNWGCPNALTTSGSRQWPPPGAGSISVSLAGIAIGPRSTVDRCFISYDLQKHNVQADTHASDRVRRLSVDSPLIFAQAADQSLIPAPVSPYVQQAKAGPLAIFAYVQDEAPGTSQMYSSDLAASTILPVNYRDVNNVLRAFSTVTPPAGNQPIATPLLHLLLYLKAPPTFVPLKRAPLIISTASPVLQDGIENIVAQVPIYGRKSIRLMLRAAVSGGSATIDWRVGALRALSPNPTGLGAYEEPVDSATAVPFQTPVVFEPCIGHGLGADYLNVYATLHNVDAGDVNAVIQMSAYD